MDNPGYYAVIPASVRYDTELCANAKLLYGEITALASKEGFCWASNAFFARVYGVSRKAVSEWISSLARREHIVVSVADRQRRLWIRDTPPRKDGGGATKRWSRPTRKGETEYSEASTTDSSDQVAPSAVSVCPSGGTGESTEPQYPPEFVAFWEIYPRRVGKRKAHRCWLAARRRGVDVSQLRDAAVGYAKECSANGTADRFMKHPGTFLGPDEPWKDYLAPPAAEPKKDAGLLDVRTCPNGHLYVAGHGCRTCGWEDTDAHRA